MIWAAVAHAEDRANPPPPELIWAWRTQRYGPSRGKGWWHEPAGMLARQNAALNVYEAWKKGNRMKWVDFVEQYPDLADVYREVLKLRREDTRREDTRREDTRREDTRCEDKRQRNDD